MIGLSEIQREVERVIKFSQAYPFDLNCEPLINQWLEAKKPFIDMFGGLVYRSPKKISVSLSEEERQKSFAHFINNLTENGIFAKAQPLGELSFLDFLYENKDGFLLNRIMKDYPEFHIAKNQKLMKVIRKFFDDEPTTRWVQDTASTYIQNDKIEGYLYFSVHPLDYLLMSETNLGWKSCHALDGDYRGGNLNYMVDYTTFVVYLADEDKVRLRCIPEDMKWYNKKWRMLVHTNLNSVIYYAKGYPFMSQELTHKVFEQIDEWRPFRKFTEPMDIGFNQVTSTWNNTYTLSKSYISYMDRICPTSYFVDYSDYNGFKDLTESFTYAPICSISAEEYKTITSARYVDALIISHHLLDIKIGEEVKCPVCGKTISLSQSRSNFLLCNSCRRKYDLEEQAYLSCTSCGRRIYDNEPAYRFDDTHDIYCKKCYNSLDKGEREHGKAWRRSKRKSNDDN